MNKSEITHVQCDALVSEYDDAELKPHRRFQETGEFQPKSVSWKFAAWIISFSAFIEIYAKMLC